MFKVNEDLSIYVTRGDIASIKVNAMANDVTHTFKAGDVIRFKVVEKRAFDNVILQKDFSVDLDSEIVTIELTEKDTRIGGTISKPVDYWYEIELNPFENPQTIVGYDENGPKVFRLYPEAKDLEEDEEITEEDIPIVDVSLDATSHRPVENQAIAREFASVKNDIAKNANNIQTNNTKNTADLFNHTNNHNNPHKVTAEQVGARPNTWMPTATDVGARPNTWMPTASEVGARPDTWMPNASQVGARPDSWMPSAYDVGARPNTWMPTATEVGAVDRTQVTNMINEALGVIENGSY